MWLCVTRPGPRFWEKLSDENLKAITVAPFDSKQIQFCSDKLMALMGESTNLKSDLIDFCTSFASSTGIAGQNIAREVLGLQRVMCVMNEPVEVTIAALHLRFPRH